MNKFKAEALKRWPKGDDSQRLNGINPRFAFKVGADFGYTAGLADAARAIEAARSDGWIRRGDYWVLIATSEVYRLATTAQLIEKYKME